MINLNFNLAWILVPIVVIIGLTVLNVGQCNSNTDLETYNRQLGGDLTLAEHKLQSANNKLGVSNSELMTQKELAEKLQKDNEEKDEAFEKFKEENNLVIKSRDRAIAELKQKIKGGTSEVILPDVVECIDLKKKCLIGYHWQDNLGRFQFSDPNIFNSGDETLETSQMFRIHGEIYEQKDGSLQTRRLVLREVYKDAESGEYKDIPDAKADIIDSDFQYHNPPSIETEWNWTNLFTLRPIVLGSVKMIPDIGNMDIGVGLEILGAWGVGLNTHTSFNFSDPRRIGQYIGLSYSPTFFGKDLNFGLGLSIGTPFYKFGQEADFKIDLLFYLF